MKDIKIFEKMWGKYEKEELVKVGEESLAGILYIINIFYILISIH